ncbi:MAG TPA: hypothetical protein VD763_13995 [Candidatus Saccharimonadales bacterium]|nr:hypothetical protein [Candidatus Saccharimonadales bacterium]
MTRPARAHRRRRWLVVGVLAIALVAGTLGSVAIATDAFGAGERWQSLVDRVERFVAGPVPDRPTRATVRVTEPPVTPPPTARPTTAPRSGDPTPAPTPTPTPEPERAAVDVDLAEDPEAVFASEIHKDWCAPAGVQMVLAQLGLVDTSEAVQREIAGRIHEWEAKADSLNGDWGPSAIALALEAYGAPGYEVRAFESRAAALRDSATAIETTGSPVVLLTWRGAHTWVMTGYRADADPTVFPDAEVTGTYILDPWFPRVSSIWGPSDPAGTFQDAAEMRRNFLEWRRPEGHYPDRDGLYITVAPTLPAPAA